MDKSRASIGVTSQPGHEAFRSLVRVLKCADRWRAIAGRTSKDTLRTRSILCDRAAQRRNDAGERRRDPRRSLQHLMAGTEINGCRAGKSNYDPGTTPRGENAKWVMVVHPWNFASLAGLGLPRCC
jgi:hypothetical protein